jgi:hypothetical protein
VSSYFVQAIAGSSTDVDHNGLPDSWELIYWPVLSGRSATEDGDRDGLNELQELAFGLNPTIADSALQPMPVIQDGCLTVAMSKRPGVMYEVQTAGTLVSGHVDSFSPATTTVLVNDKKTLKVRDNFTISQSLLRFIRVKIIASP